MAAGKGTRLGGTPKQFRSLGHKKVWEWSLDLARSLTIDQIVLVLPEDSEDILTGDNSDFFITSGGSTRALSVIKGLEACSSDWVLIHDGARPFASSDLCRSLMDSVSTDEGAIPVLPIDDAVKKINSDGSLDAVNRDSLLATQTPQVFHRLSLLNILKQNADGFRDEAEAWLESGGNIVTVPGEKSNFKITTEEDWNIAQDIVSGPDLRIGLGFDVHPLVPGRPLILGGIEFDSPLGLAGHSDADLICHSIADGILGAAGLPDIGLLFPASDDSYKNADSYALLLKVIAMALDKGWDVQWVDVVLNAQLPRIGNRVQEIKDKLNEAWGKNVYKINLKIKSGEGVGAVGEGLCMTCHASVTAKKISRLRYRRNRL
ncbi:2-C-methyl-D-erythritol 2,4-cyclodiphosphate synthase [Dethiosulfovibrio salsuginis]|nr:2-C-methyl-D-erythritol 2,4-cyclodiphosphate synthase [Dethiosulfovibrio salsuginis]